MNRAFSIRNPLQGELMDFLRDSGIVDCTHTADLIRDLTCLLAIYREEDVPLYPSVFVLPKATQVSSISPGTERVIIGINKFDHISAASILKNCAPLAENGWAIYIGKTEDALCFEYGLFRSLPHTFARSAIEAMNETVDGDPAILIRNRGHLVVELLNARGQSFTVSLTSAPADQSNFMNHVSKLVDAASLDLKVNVADQFKPYLQRLLAHMLQRCHGTLCAVYQMDDTIQCPEHFKKGVWLQKPLLLATALINASSGRDGESLAHLQSLETLVNGMINSDGIVVFGTNGTALGYRVFLEATDEEKRAQQTDGGGRLRTYALMKGRLQGNFKAAFYRSQDGATACERNST